MAAPVDSGNDEEDPTRRLSRSQARRITLGAQGFAVSRPVGRVDARHLRRVIERVGLLQLDSVNVLTRAHYLPVFSRLGPYPATALDDYAYRRRSLFEYWGHEASLLPIETYPLFRHRMVEARPGARVRKLMEDHPGYVDQVYREVAEHGPLSVSDLADSGARDGPWWGYGPGKIALEWLFAEGRLACGYRSNFVRYYDLPERVIPAEHRNAPAPRRADAQRALILRAARAHGVGTIGDLADYYRIRVPEARPLVADLVSTGELEEVEVEGWRIPAYLATGSRTPRAVRARTLLTPFDPVVWARDRVERLFGFRYRIEIYVPAERREFGYYVLPFLLDDLLVARVDLKADRAGGRLLVRGAFIEPGHDGVRVARELAAELTDLASWLGLERVEVSTRGDLAGLLQARF